MTRVLHRISRTACPASDRPWLDALFAELDAVESARARLVWLLGAVGLVAGRRAQRLAAMVSPAWLASLFAVCAFSFLAFVQYEGFVTEDDWYLAFAAAAIAVLIAVSAINLRRRPPEAWP
jgi:cytochrome bd-type quinol oxidase subunit 2